jgi:hypothetical protein
MPQLQQLADRRAAVPQKTSEATPQQLRVVLPGDAVPLHPPVPTSVLFNVADGYAYQVAACPFDDAAQLSVCVFVVRRVALADTHVLSRHIAATSHCGLPFCTVEGGVTWHDVVVTLALSKPLLRGAVYGWNVQVLGLDACSGVWLPITPVLSSPLEAHYFLQTNVEVLFDYYAADMLHMQATPLVANPAGADWRTPSERSTAPGNAPPPAPAKDYHNAPQRACFMAFHPHSPPAGGDKCVAVPPRSLVDDFAAARTPSQPAVAEAPATLNSERTASWSLAAFLQQHERWRRRTCELWRRVDGMSSLDDVLRCVCGELQRHQVPQLTAADDKGAATWTLSLLEYECQLLCEKVHDLCIPTETLETNGEARATAQQTCRKHLRYIQRCALKVRQVVDAVWRAEQRAEEEGAVPAEFPTRWLHLLLTSLRLRCLRHSAFVYACTKRQEASETEGSGRACGQPPSEGDTPCSEQDLVWESIQTAGTLLESLVRINETPNDARLPHAALSEPLLTTVLSLAELAVFLPMDTAHRCVLLRAVVHVCRIRLQSIAPRGDTAWLPTCVMDVTSRMQEKLRGLSLASCAFAAYAELTELLLDTAGFAAELNARAELPPQRCSDERASPCASPVPVLGYTLQRVATAAAVDDAFVRSNTAVREFRCGTATCPPSPNPLCTAAAAVSAADTTDK